MPSHDCSGVRLWLFRRTTPQILLMDPGCLNCTFQEAQGITRHLVSGVGRRNGKKGTLTLVDLLSWLVRVLVTCSLVMRWVLSASHTTGIFGRLSNVPDEVPYVVWDL